MYFILFFLSRFYWLSRFFGKISLFFTEIFYYNTLGLEQFCSYSVVRVSLYSLVRLVQSERGPGVGGGEEE